MYPGQALVWVADDPTHPTGPGQWLPGEGVPKGSHDGDMIVWDPKGGPAKLGGWVVNQIGLPATQILGTGPSGPTGPYGMGGTGSVTLVWDPVAGPNGVGGWTPKPLTPADLYVPNIIPTGVIPSTGATGPGITPLIENQLYRWTAANPQPVGAMPGLTQPLKTGDLFWSDGTNWFALVPGGASNPNAPGGTGPTGPTGASIITVGPSLLPTGPTRIENQLYRWEGPTLAAGGTQAVPTGGLNPKRCVSGGTARSGRS